MMFYFGGMLSTCLQVLSSFKTDVYKNAVKEYGEAGKSPYILYMVSILISVFWLYYLPMDAFADDNEEVKEEK